MPKKQKRKYDACISTPFANLGLRFDGEELIAIDFIRSDLKAEPVTDVSKNTCNQITEYYKEQPAKQFDVRLRTNGTEFQEKVWRALQQIPPGKVITYGELAKQLNTSARAVGNACRNNPIPVIIPCHRVVSKSGLGGFDGKTTGKLLKTKEWLLQHEQALPGG